MKQNITTILEAALFAAQRHSQQKRKGSAAEPYVNHLLEVAHLASMALGDPDPNLVAAALLHDTIEDAGVTREELVDRFGDDVASLVAEVTDDKSLPKDVRKQLQIEHAPKTSRRAQVIKLADKISNVRSLLDSPPVDWGEDRKRQYLQWARTVVAGLTDPDPILKAEFESTCQRLGAALGLRG